MNYDNNDLNYNEPEENDGFIKEHAKPLSYDNPNKSRTVLALWLIITGGVTGYLSLSYELWTFFFFILQAIVGFVLFFTSDRQYRPKNMIIYMIVVALFCGGLYGLRITFPGYFETMGSRFATNCFLMLISAIGGGLLVYGVVHHRKMKRHCTVPVEGTVVRLMEVSYKYNKKYSPVFRFSYGGKKYEACEYKYYRVHVPHVGDILQIYIDPDDPVVIREPKRARNELDMNVTSGFLLFLCGLALMVLFAVSGFGLFEH
ncbi:MAG: hypothetical protein IJU51_07695 [Clostridia bacterium]|nr:hypothetical protein [Clostridia bacterium]